MYDEAARPFRRRVLLNTVSTGLGNGWAMVVMIVQLPILLGGLGASTFGTWVLIQTFSATTGWLALADLGVTVATTRVVAEKAALDDRRGASVTATSAVAVMVASGVLCAAVLATAGRQLLPTLFDVPESLVADFRFAISVFAIQVVFDLATNACTSDLEGLQRVDLSRAVDAGRRTMVAVATCTVAVGGGGLRGVAVASLVASAVGTLLAAGTLHRHLPDRWRLPQLEAAADLVRYGKHIAVLRPFGAITRTMDRVIVGVIAGPSAVALVEIATQIQNGAEAVLSATAYSVVPSASRVSARGDQSRLRELLDTGTKYSMLATMPVVVAAAILAAPLVHLWVGAEYEAAAIMAVLGLGYVAVSAPVQVGSNLLLGVGRSGPVLRAAVYAVIVNLAASIVLVHLIGPNGAFVGSILGGIVLAVPLGRAFLTEVGSTLGDFFHRAVAPVLLPSLALAAVITPVVLLPLGDIATLAVGGVLGGIAYVVTMVRTALGPEELSGLRRALRRQPAPQVQPSSSSF